MNPAARPAAFVLCAMLAPALHAENVDATAPEALVGIIKELGYRAVLETDAVGDPMIESSVGGVDFVIYFYGCDEGRGCKSVLFKAGYDLTDGTTLEVVEDWNESSLFGRAYLDDEADPWIEMSVNLFGGVSRENFADTYDWWEVVLDGFEDHIGFR